MWLVPGYDDALADWRQSGDAAFRLLAARGNSHCTRSYNHGAVGISDFSLGDHRFREPRQINCCVSHQQS